MQTQSHTPNRIEREWVKENAQMDEQIAMKLDKFALGKYFKLMKMLEALTKRVESSKKKDNDKMVKTYNSRVDQIPGAPPILKGLDSK